ncbi:MULTISPECIES: hypothetical protein [Photorhabdus]|nr:hypothetical protein [Photorhabdus bodei]MDB6369714.1 hypothetical protein [Photorhabdus bodei]
MTGVSERSQQRGNLKDNGYMAQKSRFIPPPLKMRSRFYLF